MPQSAAFQSCMDGSSWVEPLLSKHMIKCLAEGHNTGSPVRLEPATHRSRVQHTTTEQLPSSSNGLSITIHRFERTEDNFVLHYMK